MDAQLKALMNQTIAVAALSSVDASGDVTYGTPADRSAYVEEVRKEMRGRDGSVLVTTHWIAVESAVAMTDRLWLPGDSSADAKLARKPVSVEAFVDELGNTHHYEVTV